MRGARGTSRTFLAVTALLSGDRQADRAVPPSGFTAILTSFTAAAMAFLAVFILALSLATGRVAERWASELGLTSTIKISAPVGEMETQTRAVEEVLRTTSGIKSYRVMSDADQRALLAPWFGSDLPIDSLPIPRLVEVVETEEGYDVTGLRLRLQAEAPGAFLDDHTRWRRPLVSAAQSLRLVGWGALGLIVLSVAAMITLAAQSALAASSQVIRVMRLVGARDTYIARAFVRRFTLRTLIGALVGTVLGAVTLILLPQQNAPDAFLTGIRFDGWQWLWLLVLPPFSAIVAFLATRRAALGTLNEVT
ncbi:MAG: cell division protein FtsX [Litoreibacter sp.]|nr:cell division protein FtsX [Litoreibacter sp.]